MRASRLASCSTRQGAHGGDAPPASKAPPIACRYREARPVIEDSAVHAGAIDLAVLGVILAASILADTISRRTHLPRISLLVLVGILFAAVRQYVFDANGVPPIGALSEPLIDLALVMVAFLLGGDLSLRRLRTIGAMIFTVSLAVVTTSAVVVGAGLWLAGFPVVIAVSLAAISMATDPAAVREAVREHAVRKGNSRVVRQVLLGVVAIDDVWGVLGFGLAMAVLGWIMAGDGATALAAASWELGGALTLGAAIGIPAAWLTGRLRPGEPTQVEALAVVLLLAGLSSWLQVSSLVAAMFAGFMVVNLSRHHTRSFREIEHIEWPFLVFFFVLAGASIDLTDARAALSLSFAYIMLRLAARYAGGRLGVRMLNGGSAGLPKNIGLALTPQAGVAMGMALLVAERYPASAPLLVSVAVVSTAFFELIGPLLARRVLRD